MDLLDLHQKSRWNRGYKWLMVVIDVYSRYVVVIPMKNKGLNECIRAYKEAIRKMGKPANLNTDLESSFMSKRFQNMLKADGTQHWANNPEFKRNNSIVERWNRTCREYLKAWFEARKTRTWIGPGIEGVVKRYNSDKHRMIRAVPIEVWEGRAEPNQTKFRPTYDIDIGDRVRYLKKYPQFTKISAQKVWSRQVYKVVGKDGKRFTIESLRDSSVTHRKVGGELQKVTGPVERYEPPEEPEVPRVTREEVTAEERRRRAQRRLAREGITEEGIIEGPRTRRRAAAEAVPAEPPRRRRAPARARKAPARPRKAP
ncbi:MAG: transposase family protein, partial [archaeon]|nr:transposase family protein [archaeon]